MCFVESVTFVVCTVPASAGTIVGVIAMLVTFTFRRRIGRWLARDSCSNCRAFVRSEGTGLSSRRRCSRRTRSTRRGIASRPMSRQHRRRPTSTRSETRTTSARPSLVMHAVAYIVGVTSSILSRMANADRGRSPMHRPSFGGTGRTPTGTRSTGTRQTPTLDTPWDSM